jgi:hypothetical protein
MRMFALAVCRTLDADEVFMTPESTDVLRDDVITRWQNGPDTREALDVYLLTGRLPDVDTPFTLESPYGSTPYGPILGRSHDPLGRRSYRLLPTRFLCNEVRVIPMNALVECTRWYHRRTFPRVTGAGPLPRHTCSSAAPTELPRTARAARDTWHHSPRGRESPLPGRRAGKPPGLASGPFVPAPRPRPSAFDRLENLMSFGEKAEPKVPLANRGENPARVASCIDPN